MVYLPPVALALVLLLSSTTALGGAIAVVRPRRVTQDLTETLSRLHGELLSVGLRVVLVAPREAPAPSDTGVDAWVEATALAQDLDAVIDIGGDSSPEWVDVWLVDRSPPKLERSRVVAETGTTNASERLAIRAIEVLRSGLLARGLLAAEDPATVPKTAPPKPASVPQQTNESAKSAPKPRHFAGELGVSVLTGTDGLGPAVLPVVRFSGYLGRQFAAFGEAAGLGSRPVVATAAGNAKIGQHYGAIGASYHLGRFDGLVPFVSLSAGTLLTSVQGQAEDPSEPHDEARWSFLAIASAGARLRLTERYYITLTAQVHVAEPYVAVRFLDETVATTGRPNLAISLMVGAWL